MKLRKILNEMRFLKVEDQPADQEGVNKTGLPIKNIPDYQGKPAIKFIRGFPKKGDKIYIVVDNDWQSPSEFKVIEYSKGRGIFDKDGVETEFKLKVDRNDDGFIEIVWFEEID